ncbi:MAG: carbon-nitrogen hydrolase family protein [Campylobacterota bacterium]|nr:carbon-nitrogen hydrolase family protein [Campylobacterota bacterium]
MTSRKVTTLQFATAPNDYQANLDKLIALIKAHQTSDIIIAPEVILTGFDYDYFDEAIDFYHYAINSLRPLIGERMLIFTLIHSTPNGIVNRAIVMHRHQIIYSQDKAKLFRLGDEHQFFSSGSSDHITKFQVDRLTYGVLICFELRFKELWQRLEGCDIILIPAKWGKPRKSHLETLSRALAIMNQCYVIVSNASDEDMASSSAIISPNGDVIMNDRAEAISDTIDLKEIKKMRRYLDMR